MVNFSIADLFGIAFFVASWTGYYILLERGRGAQAGLNFLMNAYRERWMLEMAERDIRIVDSSLIASLQNGTAFFASTSLLAIGGSAAVLRSTDALQQIFSDLPLGVAAGRGLWEVKVLGLIAIFGYAFFKFAWSYRLFNYTAILIGAVPPKSSPDKAQRRLAALQAAHMNIAAGRHFTRGQRAFFFALAYLGWFVGPYLLIATTAAILYVMWARQFTSDARRAVLFEESAQDGT